MDRNVDPDRGALAQPHEIHMQRHIAHRIELEIARDDAVLFAIHLDLMDGREEAARIDALAQIGIIERNRQRRLAVAIDNSGYAAGATLGPGGPLACPRACRRLDLIDGRHRMYPRLKPCNAKEIPRQPPGVPVMPRGWRAYNGVTRGKQGKAATRRAWRLSGGKWHYALKRGPVDIGARAGLGRRAGHGGQLRKSCFERRDARLERLIVLARDSRHLLDRLELLALDHIEIA